MTRDQLNTLFKTSPLGISLTTLEGAILAVNPGLEEMTGYTEQELLKLNLSELYHDPDERKSWLTRFKRAGRCMTIALSSNARMGACWRRTWHWRASPVRTLIFSSACSRMRPRWSRRKRRCVRVNDAWRKKKQSKANAIGWRARPHDSVTQSLYSATLIAETLPKCGTATRKKRGKFERFARVDARRAHRDARTALGPASRFPRRPSVGRIAAAVDRGNQRTRTHLPISTSIVGRCELPANVQVAFYRITQESLNNIHKHAQAEHAWVNLDCDDQRVILRVLDDGIGFGRAQPSPGGWDCVGCAAGGGDWSAVSLSPARPGAGPTFK